MELISLIDAWERDERLERETIGEAYKETLTMLEAIEYLLKHHYDFYVSYDGDDEKTTTLYVDMTDYEYQFKFNENDELIEKTRNKYVY